jgi:UDP-glucose 4-epimerase
MDVYAESKLQAEHDVAAAFGAGLVIIRPAAVIGPGCPGNIAFLIKLLKRGVPLPLGLIENRRSFIAREDLCAITLLAVRAENPPESILAAHPETIGTPDLVRALAEGLDVKPKLLNWPPRLLGLGSAMLGRAAKWQSISGNFVANPAAARALGWQPAETLAETLRRTARYHVTTQPKA